MHRAGRRLTGWDFRGYSETGVEQVWKMYHNEEEFRELRRKNAREYYPDCKESFDVGKSPCLGLLFRAVGLRPAQR